MTDLTSNEKFIRDWLVGASYKEQNLLAQKLFPDLPHLVALARISVLRVYAQGMTETEWGAFLATQESALVPVCQQDAFWFRAMTVPQK